MRIANFVAAAAALSMIAAPVAASAQNPAAKLSVASSQVRTGTATKDSSKNSPALGIVAAIILIAGVGFGTGLFNSKNKKADSQ